jgi:hypothetical protein
MKRQSSNLLRLILLMHLLDKFNYPLTITNQLYPLLAPARNHSVYPNTTSLGKYPNSTAHMIAVVTFHVLLES